MTNIINPQNIRIEDYTYNLPQHRIAKHPIEERDKSKLLVYNKGKITGQNFRKIPELLEKDDLLVYNDTKVIQARLNFKKESGAEIEIFCLEPYDPADFVQIFETYKSCQWICLVGNVKKWKKGSLEKQVNIKGQTVILKADKISTFGSSRIIEFSWDNKNYSFAEMLEAAGIIPIPPYLNRKSEESDLEQYQTVYSNIKGSVAAPTAGLHFSDNILKQLRKRQVNEAILTLHVGAGTFKPVSSDTIGEHEMHKELFIVPRESLVKISEHKNRIIAVGTTSTRTLESLYWLGVKIISGNYKDAHINQWEAYSLPQDIPVKNAIEALLNYMDDKALKYFEATTQIIIVPGYRFRIVDILITNFHMPGSTLLLLIAAFVGNNWKKIYDFALNNNFRFLSYGDSSLLIP